MAMRCLVGKLKALTPRMPRSAAALRKDWLAHQRPLIDPTKYDSVKELNEALPPLIEKRHKAEQEAFERYVKAYNRDTYVTTGAVLGATIWGALWFLDHLLEDD